MIKNVLLSLVSFITLNLFGQQNWVQNPLNEAFTSKVKLVKSVSYDCIGDTANPVKDAIKNEERFLHERFYNDKGILTKIRYVHPEGEEKYSTIFTRDKKGLLILQENKMANGKNSLAITREYNKKGMMVAQTTLDHLQKMVEKKTFTYKDTFKIAICVLMADSTCPYKVNYIRDKKGKIIEENWYDADCKTMVSKVITKYDLNNNLIGSRTFTPADEVIAIKTYSYDKSNRLTQRIDYDGKKNVLKQLEYTYDGDGKLRQEIEAGRKGELKHKYLYNYDSLGRLDWEYKYSLARDADTYIYFTYDKFNNVIQRKHIRAGAPEQIDKIIYTYDKNGNWVKRIQYVASRPTQIDERTIEYYE